MKYQEASAGKRIGAYLLDYIFVVLVSSLVATIFMAKEFGQFNQLFTDLANQVISEQQFIEQFTTVYTGIMSKTFLISIILAFLYFVVLAYLMDGATLGKKILSIKVVKEGEDKVGFGSLLIRDLLMKHLLNSLTCGILNIISFIKILASSDKRAVHDLASSTRVVDLKSAQRQDIYDL